MGCVDGRRKEKHIITFETRQGVPLNRRMLRALCVACALGHGGTTTSASDRV